MRKTVFALAITAAACSSVALADDLKQDQNAPAVKAQVMSDSEMDKVTAGAGFGVLSNPGTPNVPNNGTGNAVNHDGFGQQGNIPGSPFGPGLGVCTAGRPTCVH